MNIILAYLPGFLCSLKRDNVYKNDINDKALCRGCHYIILDSAMQNIYLYYNSHFGLIVERTDCKSIKHSIWPKWVTKEGFSECGPQTSNHLWTC